MLEGCVIGSVYHFIVVSNLKVLDKIVPIV